MSAGACSRGRGYVGGGRRGAVRHGRHRAPDAMVRPTLMSPPPFHGDSPFGPRRVTENNTGWDLLRTWSGLGQVCGQAPSTISSHTAPDSVHAPAREHPQHVIGCSARTRPLPSSCKGLLPGWRHGESNPGPPACKSPTTKRVGLHRAPSEVPQWPAGPVIGPAAGTAVARSFTRPRERQRSSWPRSQRRLHPYHRIYCRLRGTWPCS